MTLQAAPPSTQARMHMSFIGANRETSIEGIDALASRSNYFIGNDERQWRRQVQNFARVRYRNIYPGIDIIFYGKLADMCLEYKN